jgi:hypothetical protein
VKKYLDFWKKIKVSELLESRKGGTPVLKGQE